MIEKEVILSLFISVRMYKVSNTLTSAYGDMDMSAKQGPVRKMNIFYNFILNNFSPKIST